MPGTYHEQVWIQQLAGNLTIQGYTCDARSYQDNEATITHSLNLGNTTHDDETAALRLWTPNVKVYNLNMINTFGEAEENGQVLAVSAYKHNQGFYACQFWSYQDTVLTQEGNQLYPKTYVSGAVDFIFGMQAIAWFEKCDIRTVGPGCVTASGRYEDSDPALYVFNQCTVDGDDGFSYNYLGRPWRNYSRDVFQDSYLGPVINPAGWSIWDPGNDQKNHVFYGEYHNYGPGSILEEDPRANFSQELRKPLTIHEIFGRDFTNEWRVDIEYMQ